jgi:hypothetical protein
VISDNGKYVGIVDTDYLTPHKHRLDAPPEAPQVGDLRIVRETKVYPQRWRVDWYGVVAPRFSLNNARPEPRLAWRVARSFGDDGYFPTLELALEALEGPVVEAYYRRNEAGEF